MDPEAFDTITNEIIATAKKAAEELENSGNPSRAKAIGTLVLFAESQQENFKVFLNSAGFGA